ncbi:BspA family leucine-rich repeat surface protein, partial [Lactobacillus apis]
MKKTSDFKSKILLSTSASILLGLILSNPRLAKADSLSTDQDNQSDSPATRTVKPNKAGKNTIRKTDQRNRPNSPATRTVNLNKAGKNTARETDQNKQLNSSATRTVNPNEAGKIAARETDQNNQPNSSATPDTRSMSPDEVEENNAVNTADSQIGSTGTRDTVSQATSARTDTAQSVSPRESNVVTGQLFLGGGGSKYYPKSELQASYNFETDELTIFGGTYCDPKVYTTGVSYYTIAEGSIWVKTPWGNYNTYELKNTKKIKIVGKISPGLETFDIYSFGSLFADLTDLTEIEGLDNLDTTNRTRFDSLFEGCSSLTTINLDELDMLNVTSIKNMFARCSSLTSFDLSSFDTSGVEDMSGLFYGCSSLTNLNLSSLNTSQVTSMSNMFGDCTSLTQLDLSNFDTYKTTELGGMFAGATSLVDVNVSSFTFNPKEQIDMEYMFEDCSSLVNLDLSNFKTHRSAEVGGMFRNCTSLKTLNIKNLDLGCLFFDDMFKGVNNLEVLVLGHRTPLINVQELEDLENYDPNDDWVPGAGLNIPGIWANVGKGTIENPEASTRWTSFELMKNRAWFEEDIEAGLDPDPDPDDPDYDPDYNPLDDYDLNPDLPAETYVRVWGKPVTIHYQDENGNAIKEDDVHPGHVGENFSF